MMEEVKGVIFVLSKGEKVVIDNSSELGVRGELPPEALTCGEGEGQAEF